MYSLEIVNMLSNTFNESFFKLISSKYNFYLEELDSILWV